MSRIVIVGAGMAGLSAACHLVGSGHEVTVLERSAQVGGLAGRLQQDGFTFDTGPTVMTMSELVYDALRAAGVRDPEQAAPMRRLDPAYNAHFADGSTLQVRDGVAAMRAEIAATAEESQAQAWDAFVPWLERLYETEFPHFIDRNFDHVTDLVANPAAAAKLLRMGAFRRLGPLIDGIFDDDRLRRLFTFQALYAGISPRRALAIYAVITYLDCVRGVLYPEGGMHALPQAMADAVVAAGGRIHTGVRVTGIDRDSAGRIAGVRTDSGNEAAVAVIHTGDLGQVYRDLLPELSLPRMLRRPRHSPSAVVWHVGARGLPDAGIGHHNVHFGRAWDQSFRELLTDGRLMSDPSRLVTVPSITDPTRAPNGCSTLYVLEPVPNLNADLDWTAYRAPMRERLLAFLDGNGYPTDVVADELVTPADWAARGLGAGTPFAFAHTFAQTGPFRAPNHEKRVPGMYFAGHGTTPGVGVPMVLISGKLAAARVIRQLGRR